MKCYNNLPDNYSVPNEMKAWVLKNPNELELSTKKIPVPGYSEVLVRVDAVAICATDLDVISKGPPAVVQGGNPFNKNFTPGHEYMGTVVALGPSVNEFKIGDRVTVEIHSGCGQCKRCRMGMYTSCHNYGLNYGNLNKGHKANGFTSDGGFKQFAINHINTLIKVPDEMSDEEATLVVTAGTTMYGLTELGGIVAGESLVIIGPGAIGLLGVAVAKTLGADPVILIGTRESRLEIGKKLGADFILNINNERDIINSVKSIVGNSGVDYVIECSGTEQAINDAIMMTNRGGKICLAAFPHKKVNLNISNMVINNIYMYGIRGEGKSATHRVMALMKQKKFDVKLVHTHTFKFNDLPTALDYAKNDAMVLLKL